MFNDYTSASWSASSASQASRGYLYQVTGANASLSISGANLSANFNMMITPFSNSVFPPTKTMKINDVNGEVDKLKKELSRLKTMILSKIDEEDWEDQEE